jgi:multiple sugar transport system permease protein
MALSIQQRDQRFGFLLTLPGLATLFIIIVFPLFFTVITSFYDYTLLNPKHDDFVGLENYQEVLEEEYIGHSVIVTIQFVLATVFIEFVIGFALALALDKVQRFKSIYYLILLAPLMINPVVVGLMWRMILHTELGIMNYLLKLLTINRVNWLGDSDIAFWTIVFSRTCCFT